MVTGLFDIELPWGPDVPSFDVERRHAYGSDAKVALKLAKPVKRTKPVNVPRLDEEDELGGASV
jgi:hypothetical protein